MPIYPQPKPEPYALVKDGRKTTRKKREDEAKHAAKRRDSHRCRWPRFDHDTPGHKCIGRIESAHQRAKGMGGDPLGVRSEPKHLLTACKWIHQDSPECLERHGRSWEGLTGDLADGPIAFYRDGQLIAYEREIGVLETE